MLARILPLSRSNVPTRSTMTLISWATPKMYSRSERLNCLTEMMSLPYQGAERWSPNGKWGFFVGLGMAALLRASCYTSRREGVNGMTGSRRSGEGTGKEGVRGAPAAPLAREQKEGGLWKGIGNSELDAAGL